MKIFKYGFQGNQTEQFVKMPKGAAVLTFQAQHDDPVIWAEVDPDAPMIKRKFWLFMTGEEATSGLHYIGTAQFEGGAFVLHAYTDRVEYTK